MVLTIKIKERERERERERQRERAVHPKNFEKMIPTSKRSVN